MTTAINKQGIVKFYHPAIQSGVQVSKERLNGLAVEYNRGLEEAVMNLRKESTKTGDEFIDEVFNDYKDDTLFSWIKGTEHYHLHLSKYREIDSDYIHIKFCYLLEMRDENDALKDMESWDIGEEDKLLTHLRDKHNIL